VTTSAVVKASSRVVFAFFKSVLSTAKNIKAPFFKNEKKEKTRLYNRERRTKFAYGGLDGTKHKRKNVGKSYF